MEKDVQAWVLRSFASLRPELRRSDVPGGEWLTRADTAELLAVLRAVMRELDRRARGV